MRFVVANYNRGSKALWWCNVVILIVSCIKSFARADVFSTQLF